MDVKIQLNLAELELGKTKPMIIIDLSNDKMKYYSCAEACNLELELPQRYWPNNIPGLCEATGWVVFVLHQ